jgi:hypothetical protein
MDLAQGRVQTGLAAYQERGHVRFEASREDAKRAIARDWMAQRKDGKAAIVLAHTRADARGLNAAIRKGRAEAGELGKAAAFETDQGKREFAAGDRIVFLKNDRELGVKNGTLGAVETAEEHRLTVILDGETKESRKRITVEAHAYAGVDHGYAVTIHKAQGATVDRAFVLASGGMDRHLTYVAMTRHREQATLYAGRDDFETPKEMAWRVSRRRTNETTLDFAERRGIDTVRDWIANGRALLRRAQARFEQAAARIGERLGLGRSLREELRERQQGQQAPAPAEKPQERPEKMPERQSPAGIAAAPAGAGAAPGDMPPAARWKAAIEAETKAVQAKALRIAANAERRRMTLAKQLDEIERAAPIRPSGLSALFPGAEARYEGQMAKWTKERNRLVQALSRTREREVTVREFTAESVAGYRSRGERLAERRAEQRHPELAQTIQAGQERLRQEQTASIRRKLEKQRERERGGRGR